MTGPLGRALASPGWVGAWSREGSEPVSQQQRAGGHLGPATLTGAGLLAGVVRRPKGVLLSCLALWTLGRGLCSAWPVQHSPQKQDLLHFGLHQPHLVGLGEEEARSYFQTHR